MTVRAIRVGSSIAILAAFIGLWLLGSSLEWWRQSTIPRLGDVIDVLVTLPESAEFRGDLYRTLVEMVLAFGGGVLIGGFLGFVFWRFNAIGQALEPYLVALYAVPLVVFYPVLLVEIGINQWPIVILSTVMAMIPMALNTWTGFRSIPAVQLRLADSLEASSMQRLVQIAIPSAAPLVFAGIRLAAVYSLIGVIAMEFVVAGKGLGFRIRYRYELFDQPGMFAYIIVVFLLAIISTAIVTWTERRVGAHREAAAAP